MAYYHGGPRGLRTILPAKETGQRSFAAEIDPRACDISKVCVTTEYAAAVLYAASHGNGTVYEVKPVGDLIPDPDCHMPGLSFVCERAEILRERRPKGKQLKMARKALLA
jgi:hypothetical protein